MFFLNPTYLWALLGLAVPIAIHLWSKKEGKTIKIGSIQLLSEADSKQSSNIKLNELLLLLLRLLLISIVVLLLAEPQLKRDIKNTKLTYLIEPSLLKNKSIIGLLDTISTDASFRLLQNNFPEFELDDAPILSENIPNYWQLAQEMPNLHSDSIVVFSNGFLKGLKGKRPEINTNVEWIVFDEGEPSEKSIKSTKKKKNIELLSVISNSQRLYFKKEIISENSNSIEWNTTKDSIKINDKWIVSKTVTLIKVLIYNDIDLAKEAYFIYAGIKAVSKYSNHPIEVRISREDTAKLSTEDYECVVWLSNKKAPQTSGKTVTFKADTFASSLIESSDTKNVFHITKKLNSENVIDEYLAEHLLKVLDLHSDIRTSITKNDKRIVAKEELQTVYKEEKTKKNYASVINLSSWLWILLAGLLVLERIIANYRKQ